MEQIWETDNRKLSLHTSIKCQGTCRFRVIAEDFKPNSKYADRIIDVEGYRTIHLNLPVTPNKLKVTVQLAKSETSKTDYIVGLEEKDLTTYEIHLDENSKNFLGLAKQFCKLSGFTDLSPNGTYFSKNGFNIKYFPVIKDYMTGKILNTPARIGHNTGIIEVSKAKFDKYTYAMRMIIMLHEFSHKYKNPKMGLKIEHEVGADINALYMYLGLGFSKVDAIYVFANVFYRAQTDENIYRMRKIMDYIKRFETQEFAQKITG